MITTVWIPYDTSKLFKMVDLINTVNNEKELFSINKGYYIFVEIIVTFNQEERSPFEKSSFTNSFRCIFIYTTYDTDFSQIHDIMNILGLTKTQYDNNGTITGENTTDITWNCQLIKAFYSITQTNDLKFCKSKQQQSFHIDDPGWSTTTVTF